MNVAELLEVLEGYDPDLEVRLAIQPSWPLQHSVGLVVEAPFGDARVACPDCTGAGCGDCYGVGELVDPEAPRAVWLAEGTDRPEDGPYVPLDAQLELGWVR